MLPPSNLDPRSPQDLRLLRLGTYADAGIGRPGVAALALSSLAAAPRFKRVALRELGPDIWESYERVS